MSFHVTRLSFEFQMPAADVTVEPGFLVRLLDYVVTCFIHVLLWCLEVLSGIDLPFLLAFVVFAE